MVIVWVVANRDSNASLIDKNIKNRLLYILDTYVMFFGNIIIFPIAMTYSLWRTPSIELKTIAWSLFGVFSKLRV